MTQKCQQLPLEITTQLSAVISDGYRYMHNIYLKNLELHGATQGTRRDFAAIRDYAITGKIKPLVAGTFALEDLGQAQEEFKKKKFVGKLVITI